MKIEDLVVLSMAGVAVLLILKAGKGTSASAPGTSYTSVPITAANPYGINGWERTPWNRETEILMQPGGGY